MCLCWRWPPPCCCKSCPISPTTTATAGAAPTACGSGLLAAAVLHTNNIRDIRSDRAAGKRTLANLLGFAAAKRLHTALAAGGLLCYAAYGLLHPAALAAFICLPSALPHLARVLRAANCAAAGRELIPAVRLHTLANLGLSAGLLWTA